MEDDSSLLLLASGIVACTVVYVLCLMSSIAIINSRSRRLEASETHVGFGLKTAAIILKQAELYVIAAQLGMFIAPLLAGCFLWELVVTLARYSTQASFGFGPTTLKVFWIFSLVMLVLVLVTLLVQLARSIAHSNPELTLRFLSYPLRLSGYVFFPVLIILRFSVKEIFRLLKMKTVLERGFAITAADFSEILNHSAEAGQIEAEEREMIEGVFEISDTLVREIMTPRADIVAVSVDASRETLINIFSEHGVSRVLVTAGELDNVVGIVIAKDLLACLNESEESFRLESYIRPVHSVAGDKNVDEVIREFQREAVQFAIVLDEHGGVDGIVTFEDLVEEIVGEVFDEHDVPEEEQEIHETLTGDILVDGSALIDDLNEEYAFAFPEGEYDTIAGFIIHTLGHLPDLGEEVRFNGVLIRVEGINQNRITQLRILKAHSDGLESEQTGT